MANIKLNNNEYPIPDSALAAPTADFIAHLGKIAGSGLKVVVGGVEYGIDSTKVAGAIAEIETFLGGLGEERLEGDGAEYYTLAPTALSFRSTAPLNELQEIQINSVTVDPANYTLEEGSTIVTFPIDYLKTLNVGNYEVAVASDSKTVKGDFTVVEPELNEHGFYYNQPYTSGEYVAAFGGMLTLFFRDDFTVDCIINDFVAGVASFSYDGHTLSVASEMGVFNCSISSDGLEIYVQELGITLSLGDDFIVADDDYIYIYKEDLGGYEAKAIDKTKSSYDRIKTGINGFATVKLSKHAFVDTFQSEGGGSHITSIVIPNSIIEIGENAFDTCTSLASVIFDENSNLKKIHHYAFFGCTALASITIPRELSYVGDFVFSYCEKLARVTIPDDTKLIALSNGMFYLCTSLKEITIPANIQYINERAFEECSSLTNIVFSGTTAQWNAITKGTDWNLNAPATHVQCSDGQVAL